MTINNHSLTLPSNRNFGFFFTIVFFLIGNIFHKNLDYISNIFYFLSILLFFTSIFRPKFLFNFNKLWMKFGLMLGSIVGPFVLGLIFLFLFTPVSLFMKLVRRDYLRIKYYNKKTYWINRAEESSALDTFKNQF
jgi:hypothetical protein